MRKDLVKKARVEEEAARWKKQCEERQRILKEKTDRMNAFLEDVRQGKMLPASFRLIRAAKVRAAASMKSKEITNIHEGRFVIVAEVAGNRARITSPVKGWVTIVTKKGLLIDPQMHMIGDAHHAFPVLGCDASEINQALATEVKLPETMRPKKVQATPKESKPMVKKQNAKHKRRLSINSSKSSSNSSSDSGSSSPSTSQKKFTMIGPKQPIVQPKKKSTGRAIVAGRSYFICRDAVVRAELPRDSKFLTNLQEGTKVYVEKVYPKAHRAKITTPVRGWISTWTKKGRLLQ